jgi:hypothetical protein
LAADLWNVEVAAHRGAKLMIPDILAAKYLE